MTTPAERMERGLRELDELRRRIGKLKGDAIDMFALEGDAREVVNGIGLALMAEVLERADTTTSEVDIGGEVWGGQRVKPGEYTFSFGTLSKERSTYQKGGHGKVAVPLELRLGLVEGRYSQVVARAVEHAVATTTAAEAEGLLKRLGIEISVSTIGRLAKAMAARHEREAHVIEPAIRAADEVPEGATVMQVSMDGVMVPQDGEFAKPRGRKTETAQAPRHEAHYGPFATGPAENDGKLGRAWHEASVGTVAFWDDEGNHLKTVYLGEMPEERKATLAHRLELEMRSALETRSDLKIAFASDGAPTHWDHLEAMAERAVGAFPDLKYRMLVDAAHASKYLNDAAKIIDGKDGDPTAESRAKFEGWKAILQDADDGADRVLKSLRYHRDRRRSEKEREELDSIIGFLAGQHEAGRLAYTAARADGLPIGTGAVEAACKTVINVRMKRAGARYKEHGGKTIILFRTALLSGRLDLLSSELELTYRRSVSEIAA